MASNDIYPPTSPYNATSVANGKFLDFMNFRPIPKRPSDVYYKIPAVYEYRPDMLAFDLYGDSRLWWVFAARNPNRLGSDPYFEFVEGLGIYIPTQDTLTQVLGL
jgi:hypothetical protein